MSENIHKTAYWLDRDDRIIQVNANWDNFAETNEGHTVVSSEVLGRGIWEFVTGDITRMWVESLLQMGRVCGDAITRPYRCDSPDIKRFMNMTLVPEGSGVLRLEHRVIRTEKREKKVYFNAEQTHTTDSKGLVERCSVCGCVKQDEQWKEAELFSCLGSEKNEIYLPVAYTVCGDCKTLLPVNSN